MHASRIAWWALVRAVGAAGILGAMAHQLTVTVANARASTAHDGSHLSTVVTNFFSFFTIESNLAATVVLVLAAVWALRQRRAEVEDAEAEDAEAEPAWLATSLACVSTYMIVTGIVYNSLLRTVELPQGATVVWANEMLHVGGPLILLADVLFAPQRRRLGWGTVWVIVAFPVAWVAYTLVRANLVTSPLTGDPWWYPIPSSTRTWSSAGTSASRPTSSASP